MIVKTLPARAGLKWLRDALALYRRQPFAFTALVILYTMTVLLLASLPFIGVPLAAILFPFGMVGLTLAGREAERGVMPMPALMVEPFRDARQRAALFRLGIACALLAMLADALVSLVAADELAKWKTVDGKVDTATAAVNFPWDAVALAALLSLPIFMLTWFSPQLVAWHKQPVGKALFFSFFACWRNRWPFLTMGAALLGLSVAVVVLTTQLLQAFGASPQAASMIVAPVLLVLISVAYAAQYPIYRSLIEAPHPSNQLEQKP